MTTGKTEHELEVMMMDRLKKNPACAGLIGVVVTAEGDDGDWRVAATVRSGASLPPNCERAKIAAAHELRRDYHLMVDT